MMQFTIEERMQIVKIHYRNGKHFAETVRKCRTFFGHHNAPSRPAVVNLIRKYEAIGSVQNIKKGGRPRTGRSIENIAAVRESVNQQPSTSIRHLSQQLNISRSSMQRILTVDLHPPKTKRFRNAVTPVKVEVLKPEPEPKKGVKGKCGGSKKEVLAILEEEEEPESAANGDPEADQSNRGIPEDDEKEAERESPKPTKRGKGRKAAPAKEERKTVKTAGAKKMLAEHSKGRKRGDGADSKNEESSENGAQEEEVVPPPAAKKRGGRGRKRAVVESDKPESAEIGSQAEQEEVIIGK